jgi:predicted nucleic acid-binding protein
VAAISVLIDTDILIDYLNAGQHTALLDHPRNRVYYSIVSRKELLAKRGLRSAEREAITDALARFRLVSLDQSITDRYSALRTAHPELEKEDALIAATALAKRLPLMTRNWRHFRVIRGLTLFAG